MAQTNFPLDFLDSTTYHRGQTVTIRAIGYQPNQTATLSITSNSTGTTLDSESVTASADGIISTTWVVPSNAAVGRLYSNNNSSRHSESDTGFTDLFDYRILYSS